jgi:hypothetical protein
MVRYEQTADSPPTTTDLVNQPVIDHGAAYLLEQLVQRLDLADADCRRSAHASIPDDTRNKAERIGRGALTDGLPREDLGVLEPARLLELDVAAVEQDREQLPHPVQALHHGIALAAESPATPTLLIAAAHLAGAGGVRSCEESVRQQIDRSRARNLGQRGVPRGRSGASRTDLGGGLGCGGTGGGARARRDRSSRGSGGEGRGGESNATRETEMRVS